MLKQIDEAVQVGPRPREGILAQRFALAACGHPEPATLSIAAEAAALHLERKHPERCVQDHKVDLALARTLGTELYDLAAVVAEEPPGLFL